MKYADAFDVASMAVKFMQEGRGWRFRRGVERAAALAAASVHGAGAAVEAMEAVLRQYQIALAAPRINPAWDGSVG